MGDDDLRKVLLKNCKCGAYMVYDCTCNEPYIMTNREYKELEEKINKLTGLSLDVDSRLTSILKSHCEIIDQLKAFGIEMDRIEKKLDNRMDEMRSWN